MLDSINFLLEATFMLGAKAPTQDMLDWYELGKSVSDKSDEEIIYGDLVPD